MASAGTPYRLVPATFTPVGAYSQSLRYEYDRASCDKRSADRDSRKAVKHGNDGESRIQSCAFLCVKCAIGWPRHALECDMIDVPAEATVLCPICRPTVLVMFFSSTPHLRSPFTPTVSCMQKCKRPPCTYCRYRKPAFYPRDAVLPRY